MHTVYELDWRGTEGTVCHRVVSAEALARQATASTDVWIEVRTGHCECLQCALSRTLRDVGPAISRLPIEM